MVVTSGTAEQYGLTSIADLAEVCGELVIAERPDATSGLVVVLGDGTVATSFFADVLDSVRWR